MLFRSPELGDVLASRGYEAFDPTLVQVAPLEREPEVAEALRGQRPGDELYGRAAEIAARSCRPTTDQRGSAEYKRHLAGELTRRTLRRAVERITVGS